MRPTDMCFDPVDTTCSDRWMLHGDAQALRLADFLLINSHSGAWLDGFRILGVGLVL